MQALKFFFKTNFRSFKQKSATLPIFLVTMPLLINQFQIQNDSQSITNKIFQKIFSQQTQKIQCFFEKSETNFQKLLHISEKFTIQICEEGTDDVVATGLLISNGVFITINNIFQNKKDTHNYYFKFMNKPYKFQFNLKYTMKSENLSFCHFNVDENHDIFVNDKDFHNSISKFDILNHLQTNAELGQNIYLIAKNQDNQNILQQGFVLDPQFRSKNFDPYSFPIYTDINPNLNLNKFSKYSECTSIFGGPILDSHGKVLGIILPQNSYYQNVLATPASYLQGILSQYKQKQQVLRPYLGLEVKSALENKGAFVIKINSDSPSDKANLKLGDIIEEVNGIKITNNQDLLKCIGYNIHEKFELKVNSNGQSKVIHLVTDQ
ncbi:Trypsin-like cysteine/serine peptidase domain [Pseudocohnilembus persalinus]|uniref:Trypsin-like cysteine/serine peptidase domain n=1 Tax=Pseudocohnilembus persalinus TaxID=266149 RepID=A0A0V0QZW5_PSEPJ|nr:Trypsin-like cysteine/serine peptidase domain [Pseudocohnilembus persalinus]|eukprot:KRX07445.1 Trypsin-like cysteine/serine peptidase domain [Pseudocohnilembus persalinus]